MRKLAVALVFLAVAACASQVAETPAQRVFALKADYIALLAPALAYESRPRCTASVTAACSEPGIVAELRRADSHAADALDAAEAAVRTPGVADSDVRFAVAAAIQAVALVSRILEREKIQ